MSETTTTQKQIRQLMLSPTKIPILSKENAAAFHNKAVAKIFETGNGLFEYVEVIKFFAALDKQVSDDKEFIDHVRQQIQYNGDKKEFKTPRGVKFEIAEVGTAYDFSQCNCPELVDLETRAAELAEQIKKRKEFLKTVPAKGLEILISETGETITLYPPAKSSKSSFKVTLPK